MSGATVHLLRTSERSTFKSCPWAWDRTFNDHLKPKSSAPALRFGSLVHQAMEGFYLPGLKRGVKPHITFAKLYQKEIKTQADVWGMKQHVLEDDENWVSALDLGTDMLKAHYAEYGKDDRYKVIATEAPFQVPVYIKGKLAFMYVGQLDGIWFDREKKLLLIVDHKTCQSIEQLVRSLPFLGQSSAYWTWGVDWIYKQGLLKPDQQLNGIMFNMLRKAMQDDRPHNAQGHYLNQPTKDQLRSAYKKLYKGEAPTKLKVEDLKKAIPDWEQLGEVSKQQPPPYFHRETSWRDEPDRVNARQHVEQEWKVMEAMRTGKLIPWKAHNERVCGGCAFRDPCELDEAGQDWKDMLSAYTTWVPYAAHETYASETRS